MKTTIIILLFIFAIPVFADNSGNTGKLNTAANTRYLSTIEKEVVLEINRFRTNPVKYANNYIAPLAKYYKNKLLNYPDDKTTIQTREGVKALRECVRELQNATQKSILYPSRTLTKSANDLQKHQARTGRTGHVGNNNSTLKERIERYGKWQIQIAENIAYGNTSARQIVVFLLIDDGVKKRGHRKSLLNPNLKMVGVSFGKHPVYGTMCVMDFAGGIENE
jgi:uncharacterized protein YkwD